MNKHALMLTAATIALLAGPAFAANPTTIDTKVTDPQTTGAADNGNPDDLTITSSGSVVVTLGSPAIEVDSDNFFTLNQGGTVSNKDTANAIGLQFDALNGGQGPGSSTTTLGLISGTIDLTGKGTNKTGILVKAVDGAGSIYNGDIALSLGTVTVAGDGSTGIGVESGATVDGSITILGQVLVAPSSATSTTSGSVIGMNIAGDVTGNVTIGLGGLVRATGSGANGIIVTGMIDGSLQNFSTLLAQGTTSTSTTSGNPEAGSALIVNNTIAGGIYNDGSSPSSPATTPASISIYGLGPAVFITPSSAGNAFSIGTYMDDANATNFSFLNRGTIYARSQNLNHTETAVYVSGGSTANVTFDGGIFNSGSITAVAGTDGSTPPGGVPQPVAATGLYIGSYVMVGQGDIPNAPVGMPTASLVNVNDQGGGLISASVSGPNGGTATAVYIDSNSMLDSIFNSGNISASATTTSTTITSLNAYAIRDLSGNLATIYNSGSILTQVTGLDNGAQNAVAVYLGNSSNDVTFTDTGTVSGSIFFGSGNDTLIVNGTSNNNAAVVENAQYVTKDTGATIPTNIIAFGGGNDTLTIGETHSAFVSGAVTELAAGRVDITVGEHGTLTLTNINNAAYANKGGVQADMIAVNDGGTLNLSLSNGFNQAAAGTNPAFVLAHDVTLSQASTLNVGFSSFVSTPGGADAKFTLFDADGSITLGNPDTIKTSVEGTIPYLFEGTVCGYNITGGFDNVAACTDTPGDSQLVLSLAPKTAHQVGLKHNVATIFDYANEALAFDDPLGSAIVTNVTDATTANAAYSSFLPDLSGSTRAVALSITDQATGPVGARQRALRMYASQPGTTTMWGQEFVQRLTSDANTGGFRASGFGFALGADTGSPQSGRYGLALTFFSGDQTNKGPNFTKTTNEWYVLTGYTDWRGKGFFLDTQASFGYGSLNGKRTLQLTNSSNNVVYQRTAKGKRSSLLLAGGLSTGVVLTYGGTVLVPQFSLDGLSLREEAYTETGGGTGMDLRVEPYYANSLRGYFGTSVRHDIDFGGFFVQPEARVGYRYDFLADPVKLNASFASVGNKFGLTGPDPERANLVGGASLSVTTGSWSLGLNYDYLRGANGSVSQNGTLTLIGRL